MYKQAIIQAIKDKLLNPSIKSVFSSNTAKPVIYISEYFGQYELPGSNHVLQVPAIFIEFMPTQWNGNKTATQIIKIHKVYHTLANPATDDIQHTERRNTFDLIPLCIEDIEGAIFNPLIHIETGSAETVDAFYFEIDTFQCSIAKRQPNPFSSTLIATILEVQAIKN